MRPFRAFFNAAWHAVAGSIMDALFPIPAAEREVLAMGPEKAWRDLPRAPRCSIPDACSAFAYKDERVSRLVWAIKYKKSREGAALAGHALYKAARLFSLAAPHMQVLVVPMPITKVRRRQRGFNQCELIMEEMRKLDLDKRLSYSTELLVRTRHTSRQTVKDRAERIESVKGLFAADEKLAAELRPHAAQLFIVIIDDVITTGSTMKDAIETLRLAGFENAYGLSAAH